MSKEKNQATDIEKILVKRFGKEKVEAWKKEYAPRKLNIIEVEDKLAVLRPITAKEVSEYSTMFADPAGSVTSLPSCDENFAEILDWG